VLTKQQKYIRAIYLQMYDNLITYGLPRLESMELAEEAVQETFRIACEKPEEVMSSPNPEGWLMETMKNVMRNMLHRRQKAKRLLKDYLVIYGSRASHIQDTLPVEVSFHGISDLEDFKLVKAMAIDGKTHLELAREQGITVEACKKRMQRARERLIKKLKNF